MLTERDEADLQQVPDTLWTKSATDVGRLTTALPVVIKAKSDWRPRIRQYPLKPDAIKGITPVIKDLIKAKVIRECTDSPCNTPIFPVRKANTNEWRMVQDLRAINQAVQTRAPLVPDPHTLLNQLNPNSKVFTVIDNSNAFFSIPIHRDSQFWFAFTFQGKTYTYNSIPQGFSESPTIYSQAISSCLAQFHPPCESQIIIYVDDILVASETEEQCRADSIALLQYLAKTGNKVKKQKLQWVKPKVNYLGHTLTAEGKLIQTQRKEAILNAPKPKTKQQVMSFLGLCNYCRAWIPCYAEKTQPMQDLIYGRTMALADNVEWTSEADLAFEKIKQELVSSAVLALPNYSKPFIQTVDCRNDFMASVLLQEHGTKLKPVAFYSKKLDMVASALPPCVKAVCAAALAVEASAEIILFHPLTLLVPHAVDILLLQTKMQFLSPARHLSCITVLISQPHIVIKRCNTLNPATLLPNENDGEPHSCTEQTDQLVLPRPDLQDTPLNEGQVWFVDGSCYKDNSGKTITGYAVVSKDQVIEAKQLPNTHSAQAAEIIALTRACQLAKGQSLTVWTDSQYAFSTIFHFAKQWERRGMKTSTGKPVTHASLLQQLLDAIHQPQKIAICKC